MIKTHLRTICALMMVSATAATMNVYADDSSDSSASVAKPSKTEKAAKTVTKKAKAGAKSAGASSAVAGQTDIVAKVDLPMVTNITPWRDAEESVPKNILEFSALKDSLTPTDRDRLAGEIRYTSILNQPLEQK
ncbi:MAG: hypothetical protein KGO49_10130 [Gammaproteobacteria bacterium]|nr:hypothetical protein [Gammaproteobacteria bacterium]